eukprot:Amastigsp_a841141_295.p2 type:complete len:122 gc:universal Amastigsp_a841141_295:315-680(+)
MTTSATASSIWTSLPTPRRTRWSRGSSAFCVWTRPGTRALWTPRSQAASLSASTAPPGSSKPSSLRARSTCASSVCTTPSSPRSSSRAPSRPSPARCSSARRSSRLSNAISACAPSTRPSC